MQSLTLMWTLVVLVSCSPAPREHVAEPTLDPPPAAREPVARLANPASENCLANGGRHSVATLPAGGEYGVCLFEDNRQCEEWAMLRGHCPVGGRRITGYATEAARYCAITGGAYSVTSAAAAPETGICRLPSGTECGADAFYRGVCGN